MLGSKHLRQQLVVPAVAYDSTAGGLSADGETLVLVEPQYSFAGDPAGSW